MVPVQGISLEYEKQKKKGAYEGKSGGEKKRKGEEGKDRRWRLGRERRKERKMEREESG